MPEPWEITRDQARQYGEATRKRFAQAAERSWGLFLRMQAELDADDPDDGFVPLPPEPDRDPHNG